MPISVTFRNMDSTDALKDYAVKKVERIGKFINKNIDARITLSVEKHLHNADIKLNTDGFFMRGREAKDDMYAAIDSAIDKIERQIKKYKQKLQEYSSQTVREAQPVRFEVIESKSIAEEKEQQAQFDKTPPRLVKSKTIQAPAMNINEAVMHMDLINNNFFVFTNNENMHISIIYRREDGNYGLIDTSGNESGK
ncbi:MAG: ribosome-associated translation inhibitor RaiA [Myxococcota bacterium]